MERKCNPHACAVTALLALSLLSASCGDESTGPTARCYTIDDLYATNSSVSDSTEAQTTFGAYLIHLAETNGYPVFGWLTLEYGRSAGAESYQGHRYWGITAHGTNSEGDAADTEMFRVRQDGTVVLMLGCI